MKRTVKNFTWNGETVTYTRSRIGASGTYYKFDSLCVTHILNGNGKWRIGGELCEVSSGDLVFLGSFEPRRLVFTSDELEIETFSFPLSFFAAAGVGECLRVFYGRADRFTHSLKSEELCGIFSGIAREMLSDSPSGSLILGLSTVLLTLSGRGYDLAFPGSLEKNFRLDATSAGAIASSAAFINENLTSELNVSGLAKRAGMSVGHYTKLFRRYVSTTPADYIAHCRIKRFLSLAGSSDNLLRLAFDCGFSSSSGFYKTFRRICGSSPTETLRESRTRNDDMKGEKDDQSSVPI